MTDIDPNRMADAPHSPGGEGHRRVPGQPAGRVATVERPVYDPFALFGEVVLNLLGAGVLPPGPFHNSSGAILACRDLLTALGITPVESTDPLAETRRAVRAVAAASSVGAR